jgi:hypothetical protein
VEELSAAAVPLQLISTRARDSPMSFTGNIQECLSLPTKQLLAQIEVQIWPTRKRPSNCYSSCVTHRMIDNARACADKTNKIIGFIEDYSTDMFGYHMFMGTFCGR